MFHFVEGSRLNLAALVEVSFLTCTIFQTPFIEQSMMLIIKRGAVLNELRMNSSVSPKRNRLCACKLRAELQNRTLQGTWH